MHKGARGLAVSPPSRFVHPARLCSPCRVRRCPEPRARAAQVAFAPLPVFPKPVATKAPPPAREPSRELTASEQFLAQARLTSN